MFDKLLQQYRYLYKFHWQLLIRLLNNTKETGINKVK